MVLNCPGLGKNVDVFIWERVETLKPNKIVHFWKPEHSFYNMFVESLI